jgi:hypothetical protein
MKALSGLMALALGACLVPRPAAACGGFFCSATNPVNQAAERIIFAQNTDATVTAVIEIQYQGPSTNFSWLLPVSGVPDKVGIASTAAFQLLQQRTNPQYNLTVRVEGTCAQEPNRGDSGFLASKSANAGPQAAEDSGAGKGVTVEASGIVGSFEWVVISLDDTLTDPADAAVMWLGKNGYDVPQGAPGLLGPYLADGLNLLALKLKKGADTGSIRPIVLTYDASKPMIPIKLTSVAANDDMGVLAWVLGDAQAVPKNYYALELNEARINWFSASSNYNQVVSAAADDAEGQGFVTEMAGPTSAFKDVIWGSYQEQAWQRILAYPPSEAMQAFRDAVNNFSGFDGLGDVVVEHTTYPAGMSLDQVRQCPGCVQPTSVDASFVAAVGSNVVEPMRVVQTLLDSHPQMTRLYTTMSAGEMTVDPLFTFNPDLAPVNNVHTAERVIECSSDYYQNSAPWRIELPKGGIVRGGPATLGTWPTAFDSQPPNRRILRAGESGDGNVLEDNGASIEASLKDYGKTVKVPRNDSGGCSLSRQPSSLSAWAALVGALLLLQRRRR